MAATIVRRVLVVNSKGGCGKTTLATNIASHFASTRITTALMDYDPQGSSMRWLATRPREAPAIAGVEAHKVTTQAVTRSWALRVPPDTQRVVIDAPAGTAGALLAELTRSADCIVVPVLPSPIDIHAATRFIAELLLVAKVRVQQKRVAVVANRVRETSRMFRNLGAFLESLAIPFVTSLRESQNYSLAAEQGVGIFELPYRYTVRDREQWSALLAWIEEGFAEAAAPPAANSH